MRSHNEERLLERLPITLPPNVSLDNASYITLSSAILFCYRYCY